MQLLKKMGAKQILGNVKTVVANNCPNDGDMYRAYTIYGKVNGFNTGTSNHGDWVSFNGNMEGINHDTGEAMQSTVAFIPDPLQTLLLNALQDSEEIEFAFSVSVKRRDDLAVGYEYIVEPHKEAQETNPLAELKELAMKGLANAKEHPRLAAPEDTDTKSKAKK